MYRPHSDAFPNFPEILSLRNRDLKTTHNTFRGCRMHFNTLCRPLSVYSQDFQYLFAKWFEIRDKKLIVYPSPLFLIIILFCLFCLGAHFYFIHQPFLKLNQKHQKEMDILVKRHEKVREL